MTSKSYSRVDDKHDDGVFQTLEEELRRSIDRTREARAEAEKIKERKASRRSEKSARARASRYFS